MCDLHVGSEEDTPTAGANGRAEVDVFEVHEVPLVQKANRFRVGTTNKQTGAADPVWILLPPRQRIDIALGDLFLPQLRERTDHLSKRQLGPAVGVDDARSGDRDFRMTVERREQPVNRAGWHEGVAVEQQEVRAAARTNPDVVAARKPEVGAGLDDAHGWPPPNRV